MKARSPKPPHSDFLDDGTACAREAGLHYIKSAEGGTGLSRRRAGKGFSYFSVRGKRIRDAATLRRISELAIPPAWTEVWICADPKGHLQATGRDARHRKQYRYHSEWTRVRNATKFDKLKAFGECLPVVRRRLQRDLRRRGYPRDKILAAIVKIMEKTCVRVGNDQYVEENSSFGLTTIHNRHVHVHGSHIDFHFNGKSGIAHDIEIHDPVLSRIVRKCRELPGGELFAYEDARGRVHDVSSFDVNDYLRRVSGQDITAKDFRTWGGSVRAVAILAELGPCAAKGRRARRTREVDVIRRTAVQLRNTVAVCRKYYVHPELFLADADGRLHRFAHQARGRRQGLTSHERVLMRVLGA